MTKLISSISFVVNLEKLDAKPLAEKLANIAHKKGVETQFITTQPLTENAFADVDLCCVIGGDGTLLSVLEPALFSKTKVLGVNLGKLGFLATYSPEQIILDLPSLIEGKYKVENRSVLSCLSQNNKCKFALNDLVIKEAENRGLIRLKVYASDKLISEYHCDGLIFATPTGSTAYNLSAGGPIISPNVQSIAMTPICPHTLGNRSVIFDTHNSIKVCFDKNLPAPLISIDGKKYFKNQELKFIEIQIAKKEFQLIKNPNKGHFSIVRDKLKWGDPTIP